MKGAADRFLGKPDFAFYLMRTAFHGGGVVSRHLSQLTAERKRAKVLSRTECTCGCVVVVPAQEYASLPLVGSDASTPYAAARKS